MSRELFFAFFIVSGSLFAKEIIVPQNVPVGLATFLPKSETILLTTRIRYADARGFGTAGPSGVEYLGAADPADAKGKLIRCLIAPRYWGRYPYYDPPGPVRYQIQLLNEGTRPYRNLRIKALYEGWNYFRGWSARSSEFAEEWNVPELGPGETLVLTGEAKLPSGVQLGPALDRIRLQVLQAAGKDPENFLIEKSEPFLWAPVN